MGKARHAAAETVSQQLRRAVKESGQTLYRVAKGSGLAYPPLHRFVTGNRGLSLDSLDKLCAYLKLRLVQEV
jgi:hypothetical protein